MNGIKKIKTMNTTNTRVNILKFNLKRILIEERRGWSKGHQYYFDLIKKEFGDEIQKIRQNNSVHQNFYFFGNTSHKFKDYSLTHKAFTKEKVHALVGDIWIDPNTDDEIRVVGIDYEERKIFFKNHRKFNTNILQSISAKEFRNKYQLFCLTLDTTWENFL